MQSSPDNMKGCFLVVITPVIKHDNEICIVSVYSANADHGLPYLVAGLMMKGFYVPLLKI